tara:strand:+ start:2970 stop:3317 length:348 start_codon:yes stop_codon:yes gene_type:complete
MINFIKAVALQNKINNTPILRYLSELPDADKLADTVGICYHLRKEYRVSTEEFGQFKNLSTTWAGYSGNIDYPIPSLKDRITHGDYYRNANNLWAGKQLEQRVSLINHVTKHWES